MLPTEYHIAQHSNASSRIEVARNEHYSLFYDSSKNRIYLEIIGFWKNKKAVAEYVNDLKKALTLAKPDFTLLTDLQQMITHPQVLVDMHLEARKLLAHAGLKRVAQVKPLDSIANLQLDAINLKHKNYPSAKFATTQEAEAWLDEASC